MPKSDKQRLKILYIADFLMRETDDELDNKERPIHGVLISDIKDHLKSVGIEAEEHSIRRDIDLLNGLYRKNKEEKTFPPLMEVLGGKGKPVYLGWRYFPFEDVEIIAECVASAGFISEDEANELIEKLKKLCSKYQAKSLTKEYIVAERPKYAQGDMIKRLRRIREAIRDNQKVTFYYTKHNTKDFSKTELRNKEKPYIVSPFKVVLSEGKHYLVGYDDTRHQIRSYRIDRMTTLNKKSAPREGKDKFEKMGISDYAKQTFGMFISGKADYTTIKFDVSLLDTMLERFGGNSGTTKYTQVDDKHFEVKTFIVRSDIFYGWICGFGGKAVIINPPDTIEKFKTYLKKIETDYSNIPSDSRD